MGDLEVSPAQGRILGIQVGQASVIDMSKLHRDWYAFTLEKGPKPEFLKNKVAYYVMGADRWRYAPTLEAVTARHEALYLQSTTNAVVGFHRRDR